MARIDKYYGTNVMIYGDKNKKLKELGYKGSHSQFRIVCKAKSKAEANRIAQSYNLGEQVFRPNYTSETGNLIECDLANKYELIICLNGTDGNEYVDIKSVL